MTGWQTSSSASTSGPTLAQPAAYRCGYTSTAASKDGLPSFEQVTEKAGLKNRWPMKGPHVEVQDFDNDGWPDILTTASAGSGTLPGGVPAPPASGGEFPASSLRPASARLSTG